MSIIGRRKGFTVIELVVVLAIISLVLGSSIPLFSRFQASQRLKSSASDFSSALRTAQSQAITHRRTHAVVLDTTSGEFWIEDERVLAGAGKARESIVRGRNQKSPPYRGIPASYGLLIFSNGGAVLRFGHELGPAFAEGSC